MELKDYCELIERVIAKVGADPKEARLEEPGRWIVYRERAELYVDCWLAPSTNNWNQYYGPEQRFVFQVLSPCVVLPKDRIQEFYEELLSLNYQLYNCTLMLNKQEGWICIKHRRLAEGLQEIDIIEALEAVGYFCDFLEPRLREKYKIQEA